MNYTQLTQALQDYLETSETSFVNNIPTFVKQAEERIRELESPLADLARAAKEG